MPQKYEHFKTLYKFMGLLFINHFCIAVAFFNSCISTSFHSSSFFGILLTTVEDMLLCFSTGLVFSSSSDKNATLSLTEFKETTPSRIPGSRFSSFIPGSFCFINRLIPESLETRNSRVGSSTRELDSLRIMT